MQFGEGKVGGMLCSGLWGEDYQIVLAKFQCEKLVILMLLVGGEIFNSS